ncbi:putative inactive ATP-dependent zinc metalloprotease FTSHI 2, chloroplastic isoform X2 [Apium graveolens]|uniref:putative inactive ATP-dependent zinc metalloprotease FTSHI 2, chloroplastic isoform X2 n=1 Tax=Apium graveolens TaxID=4045 RepID=UPI003D7A1D64
MACTCNFTSSFLSTTQYLRNTKTRFTTNSIRIGPLISCNLGNSIHDEDDNWEKNVIKLVRLSVTLTVVSAAFPQGVNAVKVTKRSKNKKTVEAFTPEQLKVWSEGLPVVAKRIAYSEILGLKKEGRLKHIIKPPDVELKQRAEVVLVVLEDSRVLRIVLPSFEVDPKFWVEWDELGIDSVCVNAFSPPVKKPEIPSPYLGFLLKIPEKMFTAVKPKPLSKKALELKRQREQLKRQRDEDLKRTKLEQEMMENAIKMQRKTEERNRRREQQKIRKEESLLRAQRESLRTSSIWDDLAQDKNVTTLLGLLFFYIFYRTVVLSYKKQKKDYEDRLKIEKADAEEKRKMRELEREMLGMEAEDIKAETEDEEGAQTEENPYMKMAEQFMKSGARVRKARNGRLPQYMERGMDVKFTDVAGLGKIRLELEEIVKFFTHGEMYRRRGVRIPGGILLCGPPGVGKTLLAKAVAGEAGVNFFSISASQFVEIYVGVGASRVRALYQEARENAPSVVFIDELDAVGRERGLIKGSGGQERDATLNQLLVSLDGFEGRGNVITIASTNRPDILDPALVRPGRFDRKIFIPKPGLIGRVEILKVHARKKPMAVDVDYMAVASMTDGMVGAELANIIEVGAINMMREGRTEITTDDLLQAAQVEDRGMLDRKDRSPEIWKQVAINEAAMAVVAVNFPDLRNIEFLTIAPRAGRELGYVRMKLDHIKFKEGMLSRQSLLDYITVQLAPRAADEFWYGEGQEIDTEALRILNMCYEHAKEILQQNRKLMDAVVDELVLKKNITKEEFSKLVELHGSLRPAPPSILDIRVAKRLEFEDIMMKERETAVQNSV